MTRNQFYTPIGRHLARPIRSTAALQKMDSLRAQIHTNPGALLFITFINTAFHDRVKIALNHKASTKLRLPLSFPTLHTLPFDKN